MKFSIDKSIIQNVLSKIQGITGRKTSLAITTSLLITAIPDGIKIDATDLETGFEGFYPATVESEGAVALNARKLFEIVREFPDQSIHFVEIDNHWIKIGDKNIEYKIVGLDPEEFPQIPMIDDVSFFEIESQTFNRMINRTVVISGPPDDNRAHIIGTFAERVQSDQNQYFRMVSTDGSWLTKVDHEYDLTVPIPIEKGILIPKKGLYEAGKFLNKDGVVHIGFKDSYLILKVDTETLIIRLLEGEFPDYGEIISKREGHVLNMDKQLFMNMIKRMSILSSEDYRGVVFNLKEDKLRIDSNNPEIGESKEEMDVRFQGDPIEVVFNPKFFIDSLHVMDGDKIQMNIVDARSPCLIEDVEDKTFISVIMPMKL
jgi:DNA polymerase-3 subunit beta